MRKTYIVQLQAQQRAKLERLVRTGSASARKINRARILLKADTSEYNPHAAMIDRDIAQALDCSATTVQRVRRTYFQQGLDAALERSPTSRTYQRALDGRAEAHLVALACSEAPQGYQRWTIRLLADQMVELGHVETLSRETVRRVLKKTNSSPIAKSAG